MPKVNVSRTNFGKASSVAIITLTLLVVVTGVVIYYAINLSPVGWRQERTSELPLRSETLASYLEDPSTCASDLDKTYEKVNLVKKNGSIYDIQLIGKDDKKVELEDIDLRVFIPKIPKIVKGDPFLTHLTVVQRELNRNDTIFRNTKYDDYSINVANNCLREGLFETYIGRTTGDNTGKIFHGWFEFPVPLYKRLFKEINGFELDPHETAMQHYLRPDGKKVNWSHLREIKSEKEIPVDDIDLHHDDIISRMGEQQHKAKLVVNHGLHKYRDIYEKKNQPIKLMQFDEPGIYKKKKILKFDYTSLKTPSKVTLKKAFNRKVNETFNELEIEFPYGSKIIPIKNWPFFINRNGLKLVLGGWRLDDIPQATEQPIPAADFGRFTFGVGTPDIYVTYEHRLENLKKRNNVYLFLVDKDNNYVDNHSFGLDQVYISRLNDGTFVMYLVSYERIMLVTHWSFKPPASELVSSGNLVSNTEDKSSLTKAVESSKKNDDSTSNEPKTTDDAKEKTKN